MDPISVNENKQEQFDLKSEIFKYLPFWYLFVLGVIVASVGVNIYLRYQNNVYQSKTIIKLLDDSNSDFKMPTGGVNFFMRSKINIENEKEIIKSNRLLEKVVHELQLYNQYFLEGNIRIAEEYGKNIPTILWLGDGEKINKFKGSWQITYNNLGYYWNQDNKKREYNTIYDIDGIAMQVLKPIVLNKKSKTIKVHKVSLNDAVSRLKSKIEVSLVGEESELLEISTKGPLIEKNNAILNTLTDVFDRDGREDRQRIFKKTIDFVNTRFEFLFRELDSIELNKANYKRNEKLSFLEGDAGTLLATKTASLSEYELAKTQSVLSDIIIAALKEVKNNELLPTNIGLEEMRVNELVKQYNEVVLEAQRVITNGGANHPSVAKFINVQNNLKISIQFSLQAYQKVLASKIQNIDKINTLQENQYAAIPYQEKTIRAIERQQKIKETLYLLLLQKREEASINLAITNPSIKIVDEAIANTTPLSPKRGVAYLLGISLGLLIPFALIFIYYLFDTKIHRKETIEVGLDGIPILSEIPFIEDRGKIIHKNDRSILSEAFRILVANLNFVIPINSKKSPMIFVASTIKGEGKTFVASNLALTLASLGKKVVLVGTDLRNPQLHKALRTKKGQHGLVNILISNEVKFTDCVTHEVINDIAIDIIYSGDIPPNPTQILSNGKLEEVLEELKRVYDYVIVDTAPTLLVADTTIITKYADAILYLIKANYTDKQILPYINNLKKQNKIGNTSIVFNNIGQNEGYGKGYAYSYHYNYGYGYGYGANAVLATRFQKFKQLIRKIIKK
ncbi:MULTISPECIES: polysaccharide biosynthesis tyrosine autokinase [unclassified Flavobacterium]|uniref:GumC family protein n=1 Tax=unclassified Flavobacterium TaxID=196869 RepID=UPI0012914C19|nr:MULTISPECIES: polysaccharide biosynthesis tyrosine autokinase [unclassified Flavobacterium]MQP52040.1 polysaccharide biosynthesis tyrosine autokinase [Flavobacterium sp. LMO9]MQP61909.1 polysaccharide biosynthesis tyrosine autokinase [Flavobacterium sp. LMO6]